MKTLNTTTGAYWGKNQSNCLFSLNSIRTMLKCVALLLAFLFVGGNDAWGKDYTANTTGNWNENKTWGNSAPGGNDNVTISSGRTVTVTNNASCKNCTLGGATNNGNITINKNQSLSVGGTLTMNGSSSMTVNGTATIKSITASNQNSTIKGNGSLTISGGTLNCDLSGFTGTLKLDPSVKIGLNAKLPAGFSIEQKFTDCNGGAVNYSIGVTLTTGTTQIKSGTYADLYINDGVQATLCDNVTVTGNLTIKDGGTDTYIIIPNGTTLTVNGNLVINNPTGNRTRNKYIEVQNGGNLIVNGDVEIKSSGNNQRDSYLLLNDGAIVTVGGNITMDGAGDITYIRFSGNGTLNVGGTITGGYLTSTNGGSTTARPTNGTVNYTGANSTTICIYRYYNLSLSGAKTYSSDGGITIDGTLSMNENATWNFNGANTLNLYGPIECGGTLNVVNGTVYIGINAQNILKGTYNKLYFSSALTSAGHYNLCGDVTISSANFNNTYGTTFSTSYNIAFNGIGNPQNATIDANGGTVSYNGSQSIIKGTYNNLNFKSGTGLKTLAGNVTVNGQLTWPNANISLGTYDFTVNPTKISNTTYNASHMFVCNGGGNSGKLIFQSSNSGDFTDRLVPIGIGSEYRPLSITSATVSGGIGKIGFAEVPESGTGSATDLQRYWTTTFENVSGVGATLNYKASDVPSATDETTLKVSAYDGTEWNTCGGSVDSENHKINLSGGAPGCQCVTACEPVKTFYTYQTGNWSDYLTWTLDPSGQLKKNPGNVVPGAGSRVVILNGDKVIADGNGKKCMSMRIDNGGSISLGTTTNHDFGTVSGQGTIMLASDQFPAGSFNAFMENTGGTVEFNNSANFNMPATINGVAKFNNLILNFTGTNTATLGRDLVVNGDFTIKKGTFQIGNDANGRTITVAGDMLVETNGKITTGTTAVTNNTGAYLVFSNRSNDMYNRGHKLEIKGNFTNNGNVDFSNRTTVCYSDDPDANKVDVYFTNESEDQNVTINGETKFYAIICDKGTDMSRILNIDAQSTGLFHLYGYCYGRHYDQSHNVSEDGDFYLSLKIANGTVRLGNNIVVESLTGGHGSYGYKIDETACLWIDGANVRLYSGNGYDSKALYVHGKLKMSNSASSFVINGDDGMVNRNTADVEIEDGHLTTSYIRTSLQSGTHIGSLTINGGTLELNRSTNTQTGHATLSLTYPNNGFNMSGGEIIIHKANGASFDIAIGCNPGNCNITGGTVRILCNDNADKSIVSTAPFWNLEIGSAGGKSVTIKNFTGGSGSESIAIQPLVVLNDLTIKNGGTLNTGKQDVKVGHDFVIENGGTYNSGDNKTIFNGDGTAQRFTINGTISNNGLYDLVVAENATLNTENNVTVRNNLLMESGCTLYDDGKTITVNGNVDNSGTHFNSNSTAGSITLASGAKHTINGDGNGSFNNLVISSATTTTLSANTTVTGQLRLTGNTTKLDIGSYNLNLDDGDANIYSDATTGQSFSTNKMIVTAGNPSDGGITKRYNSTVEFLFPFGYGTYYLPARIQIANEPTAYGTVTSRPVSGAHYALNVKTNVLQCYWSNTSAEFEGVTNVNHIYQYADGVVNGTENSYLPGRYVPYSWSFVPNNSLVDKANNRMTYPDVKIDGDYTCGSQATLDDSPARLYSSGSGNWNDAQSWSSVGVGETGGAGVPGSATIVFIGDETHNHTITMNANNGTCGSLNIAEGSVLDLKATNGHNLGMLPDASVAGKGTMRISSNNYFPGGDFGAFLGPNGGTVEYYANGSNITPSASIVTYNNLTLRSNGTNYVTMPNIDLTVYGDLVSQGGSATNYNRFNTANNSRTLTIEGNVNVKSGNLAFASASIQNLIVNGDVIVEAGAFFNVKATTNFTNTLTLYGNMVVDGSLSFVNSQQEVATTFTGTRNDTIRGDGSISLYTLTCDKGTDATPVLYLERNISTSGTTAFLNLLNGTFRANGAGVDVTIIGSETFTIPATACLSTQLGTFKLETSGAKDVILNGKIEVLGGEMIIGNGNNGNDIEYAGGGEPEIDVQGGTLTVNGQIRRNTAITLGSLTYRQSGGEVIINGKGRNNNRALLEITNNGKFITSGGTLTFAGGAGSTEQFGDVLITPAECEATGGTIQLGVGSTSTQTFYFNASPQIYNLTLGAPGTTQYLELKTNALDMRGTLTINGNSEFHAEGFDVTIGGDIVNNNSSTDFGLNVGGFQPGNSEQITTLNGNANQTIIGNNNSINFAYLTIESGAKVSLSDIDVYSNNDIFLAKGTLDDAGNIVHIKKNVINDAVHTSSVAGGGIRIDGNSNDQMIKSSSGRSGEYGNLIVDNNVTMNDNILVNGTITLNKILDVGSNLLTLGANSSFAGTPSEANMLLLTGAIGDLGVKRMLPANFSGTIEFPVGRTNVYSPAKYIFTSMSGSNAYVTVKVIGYRHVSMNMTPVGSVDSYWSVTSGGISSCQVTHEYNYDEDDLMAGTTESDLMAKRYFDNNWVNYAEGTFSVDADNNIITIPSLSYLDGEYTAGYTGYSCQPKMQSKTSGDWKDISTWQQWNGSGWEDAQSIPNGNPVTICSGHTVTITQNGMSAYSVDITEGATLDVGNSNQHNLGLIKGGGTIRITALQPVGEEASSFKLPGGDYEDFFANTNSTIVFFNGNHNAILREQPGNFYKPFNNVVFEGSGYIGVTAQSFYAKGNVTVENNCHLDNSSLNRPFYVGGDFTDNNTTNTGYVCGTSRVIFYGTEEQTVTLGVDANFYDLEIQNPAGVTLAQNNINVANKLNLVSGNFNTKSDALISLSSSSTSVVSGGGANSFVNGPLRKYISNSSSFVFPVGNDDRYGNITLSGTSGAGFWTVQYFNADPNSFGTTYTSPISGISENEYWTVTRPNASATAKIGLRWDDQSTPYSDIAILKSRLQVVEFGNSCWTSRTATPVGSSVASGVITTNSNVTEDDYIFTLGFTGVVASITTTELQEICDDGVSTASVSVTFSGEQPWRLKYQVSDGTSTSSNTISNITTSPYVMSFGASDLGSAGTYTISLLEVSDKTSDGIVSSNVGQIKVLRTYTPTITGSNISGAGESRQYSVESHEGSTYTWSWAGSNGGTLSENGNAVGVAFINTLGTYTLKVVEKSIDNCEVSSTFDITVNDIPSPSFEFEPNVCSDDIITYATEATGGQYEWTVDGTVVGTSNSVDINWASYSTTTHTVKIKQTKIGDISGEYSQDITVHQKPVAQTIANIEAVCSGNKGNVVLNGSENNISYYLYDDGDNLISQTVSGTGNSITLTTLNNLSANTNIYVVATNLGCNVAQDNYQRLPASGTETITVLESPTISYTMPDLYLGTPSDLVYTKTSTVDPTSYSIDYTVGGVDVSDISLENENVTFKPTAEQMVGTFTIKADNGCSTSYDFDETILEGYVWSGASSTTNWNDAGNWYSGAVPTESNSVIIRNNTKQPVVEVTTAKAKDVVIEADASLTMGNDSKLSVYGDWNKSAGSYFTCGTSTVAFCGTTNVYGQTTFNKVEISGTLNAGDEQLTINGDVVNNGTFNGNSTGLVVLDAELSLSGTGTYNFTNLNVENNVAVNTNINVEGSLSLSASNSVLAMANGTILAFGTSASAESNSTTAYIDGVMTKRGSSEFTFPSGNNGRRAKIGVIPGTGADENTVFTISYSYVPTDDHSSTTDHPDLGHVSKEETWNVSCTPANTPSNLRLYWDDGEKSGITDLSTLIVAHKVDGTWVSVGYRERGGTIESGWVLSETVTSYSPFTFGSTDETENPLPVTFVDFTGKVDGNAILLEWATMSELNNEHFEIERSVDGKNFVIIGYVEGAGVSSERIDYQFIDNTPEYGYQYYRLLQVDYNGVRTYADKIIRVLYQNNEEDRVLVAPNPSDGQFRISVNGNIANGTVQIMSQNGMVVRELDVDGCESMIDITDLSNGIYFLRYVSNSKVFQQKIVKF